MSKGWCSILAVLACAGGVARADPADDEKQMVASATRGDLATVVRLLRAGTSPDARDKDGLTALNWAAYSGHLDVVKALVTHKAAVDSDFSEMRWTPLANAAAQDHLDIVKYLVAHKADVNALDKWGDSPLSEAAYGEHVEIAKFLFDHGAQLEVTTTEGKSVLYIAVASLKDDATLVKLLLERGAKTDVVAQDGTNLLEEAAASGNVEVAQILVARGFEVAAKTKGGFTPLEYAARTGKTKMIDFLLAHGAEVDVANDLGQTPMIVAAAKGFPDAVTFLLDHGAKLAATDTGGFPALWYAVHDKHPDVAKLLIARGADPADPFIDAIARDDLADTAAYLDLGVKADLRSTDKDPTPLMFVLSKTPVAIPMVKLLLDRGADAGVVVPDLTDRQTPLMWAAFQCNADAIRLLVAHGAAQTGKTEGGVGTAYDIAIGGWTITKKACPDDVNELLRPVASP